MIKKNFTNNVIKPILVFLVLILVICIFLWSFLNNTIDIFTRGPKPENPQVTYAEFPFELTYRIGDKTVTEKGTYVCDFQAVKYNGEYWYFDWKEYIKETGKDEIYITEDEERTVYCCIGDVGYYIEHRYDIELPYFRGVLHEDSDGEHYSNKEIMEHYDLEIISYTLAEPLQYQFS